MLEAGLAGPVRAGESSPLVGVMAVILAMRTNPGMDAENVTRVHSEAVAAYDKTNMWEQM